MPRSEKQKQKLFRLLEIFVRRTDMEHGITMSEIISALSDLGIKAERKSVYDDILTLGELGFEIDTLPTRPVSYCLCDGIFELAELKLLVDAVQSSKFITAERSKELIAKLERFTSMYGARELSRQVYVEGRAKTMNKTTLYTVDTLHAAINSSSMITFKYFDYGSDKKRVYKNASALYLVSPLALFWSDENYYLVAYDEKDKRKKHFRVDKIEGASLTEEKRSAEAAESFDMLGYTQTLFGMYGGEERLVTLECDESLAGVIIDRFGREPTFIKTKDGFRVSVRVALSPNFYAWAIGFGKRMRIVSPIDVKEELLKMLKQTLEAYGEGEEI